MYFQGISLYHIPDELTTRRGDATEIYNGKGVKYLRNKKCKAWKSRQDVYIVHRHTGTGAHTHIHTHAHSYSLHHPISGQLPVL